MADRVGQQLGNYRLIRKLGEGGFAEVYQAENIHIGTQAAIKLLFTRMGHDEIEDFKKEARTLANLIHPNIVRVLDFGVDNSIPYLVMDYAPGGTLRTRHPKGSRLPLPIVVEYVKQVASALQYAHDQKIVHRDIKPENMLIGRSGEILLSDFGIALIAQSSRYQSTKDMAGTIAYMAPEQIEAHPRPASDQYSLAIVVYEWLCGTRPFHGSFTEIAIKHSVTPPPPLRDNSPTLPSGVEQVIVTALAKQPDERFRSVKAFATALEHASLSTPAKPSQLLVVSQPPFIAQQNENISASVLIQLPSDRPVPPDLTQIASKNRSILPLGTILVISKGYTDDLTSVAWSPDGKKIASASLSNIVHVWDANNGKPLLFYRGHKKWNNTGWVNAVMWSSDSKWIASASRDKTVRIWSASDGRTSLIYRGHTHDVYSVVWSPDSRLLTSSSADGTIQVWDAINGKQGITYRGHDNHQVMALAWSPDGKYIASGSTDDTVQVWDVNNGHHLFTYKGHKDFVNSIAWSPKNERIVSGSKDCTVQVWDANGGGQSFVYQYHSDTISSVAWSPDGNLIASASLDGTVQVWNANDGSHPFTYHGHTGFVESVAWSPDGQRIASASDDKTVQVWQAV